MKNLFVVISLVTLINEIYGSGGATDYTQNGDNWTGLCSTGTKQSPINIVTASAKESKELKIDPSGLGLVPNMPVSTADRGYKGQESDQDLMRTSKFESATL
jgi:hypothetical protein